MRPRARGGGTGCLAHSAAPSPLPAPHDSAAARAPAPSGTAARAPHARADACAIIATSPASPGPASTLTTSAAAAYSGARMTPSCSASRTRGVAALREPLRQRRRSGRARGRVKDRGAWQRHVRRALQQRPGGRACDAARRVLRVAARAREPRGPQVIPDAEAVRADHHAAPAPQPEGLEARVCPVDGLVAIRSCGRTHQRGLEVMDMRRPGPAAQSCARQEWSPAAGPLPSVPQTVQVGMFARRATFQLTIPTSAPDLPS